LIAEHEAGARVGELAKVDDLHRTTVARHAARAGKTQPVMIEPSPANSTRIEVVTPVRGSRAKRSSAGAEK
jgi:hypothetical protein